MITWSISTKPCPIIMWDGVVFNGEHHYVDHIYYMIRARHFGLQCSEAISAYAGSSSLTRVFCVCKNWLAPIVFEHRAYYTRSSRGVLARQTIAMAHTQGEHLYLEILWGIILQCYRRTKQNKMHNKINITSNQNMWNDMAIIILCSWSPSPKHRHMISIVIGATPWSPL